MGLKELLEINPTLITQGSAAFVAVCSAFGVKELGAKIYDRYCKKADEKETDHKKIEDLTEKVDKIIEKLDKMEENDKQSIKNDLVILETSLAETQNRAIIKGKVSSSCMPRYLKDFNLYVKLAEDTADYEISQEVKLNHQRILKMVQDGKVVDNVEEWYK